MWTISGDTCVKLLMWEKNLQYSQYLLG